jgi:uncharacterized protein (TIGR03067 family)
MSTKLPARPNLDHLRTQAKHLLADLHDGKVAAANIFIEHLPAARGMTPIRVRRAGLRLADAQSAIARKSGFENWPSLARHVEHLRGLEGHWTFASVEVDAAAMPVAMMSSSRMLIDGDRFRMESPEGIYEGIFTIDVEADPHRIDIEFVEGPEAGNWSYGIYTLDGDDLTICLGVTGARRPERFATSPGSGHALERLRRASDARPSGVDGGQRTTSGVQATAPAPAVDESAFAAGAMTPLLRRLQGEWTPVTLVTNGTALAANLLAFGSRTMAGNETKVVFGGQTMVHARIRLDESATPIAVDYLNIGRGGKTVTFGIFEWAGDEARFCMAAAGAARPDDFSCDAGSGRTLSQWKRK